ncbi:MAG TPA: SWIM zinc finger family protein [Bacteroidales bacterium]|mgnify:CR=1 FL=1|nr:SWIM zinc finger family protein [Bacteroidales bacterium]
MNIKNFKKEISSEIYYRGEDYYKNGNISDIQKIGKNRWIAEVEGNYGDYNVEINLDDLGNIKNYTCNCPYDGDICKHVVAVLFSIQKDADSPTSVHKPQKTIEEWEIILNEISDQELRDFVFHYANHNIEFQDELVISLSKAQKKINTEKYRQIISHTFNIMSNRYGFIEYRDVDAAMIPIDGLLEKAEDYLSENHLHEAFSIASAVAIECLNTIQNMDDSNGSCGGAICMSFDLVDKILEKCNDEKLSNDIFTWLHEQVNNKEYNNYGCGEMLESTFFEWSNNPSRLEKAYHFIDQQIIILENEKKWNNNYRLTELLKYKSKLLIKNGKKEEADHIIDNNLHLDDFRKIKIDEALAQNDYKSAIQHLHQGILQAEKDNYQGIVYRYQTQLLKIYTQQNDQKNIRKIAKDLYFNHHYSTDDYRTYKNTFSSDEWLDEREKIISHFTTKQKNYKWGYFFNSNLADVYIEEQMWKPLLDDVIKADRIETTERYRKYLQNNYSQELLSLYNNNILKYAENTGREIYTNIVSYLKNMAKLEGGLKEAKELMQKLLDMYRNRPAMKDEFRSLNW